ncbi:sugar-binding protein [Ascidiimonas aurantiaca]|uniref:sugar-binding protein n=1 Tax=Ascidiimonas aurantiaca TaxID=1685432 RepID=UPI0030EE20F5
MKLFWYGCLLLLAGCSSPAKEDHQLITVKKALRAPVIDGNSEDNVWEQVSWLPLDQRWLGKPYLATDFKGRYKLTWTPEALYLLVEITDDVLFDQYKDPLYLWWDDDCIEIFIDEDNSGGEHQFNHNAFAYHIALDGNVVDLGADKKPHLYNEHITSKRITHNTVSIWELKVYIYDDTFKDGKTSNPARLYPTKKIGFTLAYCDNDRSEERENFIGSVYIPGEDKNQGWVNAHVFGTLNLIE